MTLPGTSTDEADSGTLPDGMLTGGQLSGILLCGALP